MSKQSEEQAMQAGHETAMTALSAQKDQTAALPPEDRLYWWLGFLAAAMGSAQSSIGEASFGVLRRSLADERDFEPALGLLRRAYGLDEAALGVLRRANAKKA